MIPMKHSSIFRNRWFAVLWAVGIIWFALDFTSPDDSAPPPDVQMAPGIQAVSGDNTQNIKDNTAEVRAMMDELHKQK